MVMGSGSRRLEVLLELKDRFTAGMKTAGSGFDKFNDSLKAARPVLLGITAAVGGVGIASIKFASDLGEAQNKANVTFGQASQVVQDFAATSGRSFGISQRAANEYTATLGLVLQASGLSQKAAADMSVELTKLAADLASFNNIPVAEALQKIQSGLVGEVEPLRRVGVLLSQAAVQAKAMELGIADASGELSEGAKVQARYALILDQTSTAQGDFTRTSGTLANQLRIAKAQMEDAAASLGTALIPATSKALQSVNMLIRGFAELPQGVQLAGISILGATGGLAALGLVIPPLVTGVSSLAKVTTAAGAAMRALIPALAAVNASVLGVVGIIGAIAIAGTLLWALFRTREESNKVVVSQDELVASMRRLQAAAGGAGEALADTDAAVAAIRESLASAGQEVVIFGANNETVWSTNQETVAQAAKDMVAVVEQYGITLDKLQPALEGLGLSHEQLAPLIEAASANTARLSRQNTILTARFKAGTDSSIVMDASMTNLAEQFKFAAEQARVLEEEVLRMGAGFSNSGATARIAQFELGESTRRLTERLIDQGVTFDLLKANISQTSAEWERSRDAMIDAEQGFSRLTAETERLRMGTRFLESQDRDVTAMMRELEAQLGITSDASFRLAGEFGIEGINRKLAELAALSPDARDLLAALGTTGITAADQLKVMEDRFGSLREAFEDFGDPVRNLGDTFFEAGENVDIFRSLTAMARAELDTFKVAGEQAAVGIAVGMRVLLGEITAVHQGIANIKLPGGQTVGGLATVAPFPWEFRDIAPPGAIIGAPPAGIDPVAASVSTAAAMGFTINFNAPVYGMNDFDDRVNQAVTAGRRRGVS